VRAKRVWTLELSAIADRSGVTFLKSVMQRSLMLSRMKISRSVFGAIYRSTSDDCAKTSKKLLYEGKFAKKLQWLRRVSITSTAASLVGFSLAFFAGVAPSSIPLTGQVLIAGTAIATSLSSTIFLQTITSPYVAKLYVSHNKSGDQSPVLFEAYRITLLGNLVKFNFEKNQVEKVSASSHPFATFRAGGHLFYVHGWEKLWNS